MTGFVKKVYEVHVNLIKISTMYLSTDKKLILT